MNDNLPKVGVGAVVIKDGKVLMGKRKHSHGNGSWNYPGGHLEFGESWEDCAKREVMEETGIKIKNVRFGTVTNEIFTKDNRHYVTICMVADYESGELKLMEPEKCEKWDWFNWGQLPEPLFLPTINQIKAGFNPLLIK